MVWNIDKASEAREENYKRIKAMDEARKKVREEWKEIDLANKRKDDELHEAFEEKMEVLRSEVKEICKIENYKDLISADMDEKIAQDLLEELYDIYWPHIQHQHNLATTSPYLYGVEFFPEKIPPGKRVAGQKIKDLDDIWDDDWTSIMRVYEILFYHQKYITKTEYEEQKAVLKQIADWVTSGLTWEEFYLRPAREAEQKRKDEVRQKRKDYLRKYGKERRAKIRFEKKIISLGQADVLKLSEEDYNNNTTPEERAEHDAFVQEEQQMKTERQKEKTRLRVQRWRAKRKHI